MEKQNLVNASKKMEVIQEKYASTNLRPIDLLMLLSSMLMVTQYIETFMFLCGLLILKVIL